MTAPEQVGPQPPVPATAQPEPSNSADIDEIQADIERTREELGETVEALSQKFDVKARAKHKAGVITENVKARAEVISENVKARAGVARVKTTDLMTKTKAAATDQQGNVRMAVPGVALVALAGVALVIFWRRRQ